jgi:protein involved in temperature-dependent protein secretion
VWEEIGPDMHRGLGQRILATDAEEASFMEVRTISLTVQEETEDRQHDHG